MNEEQINVENNAESKMSLIVKLKNLITVEPVLFAYLCATTLATGALLNLQIEMGCRVNLQLNDTICRNISLSTGYVALHLGRAYTWSQPISTVIPAFLVLCFGSFSDRYKWRKPFFILPVIGELFCCIALLFCAFYINFLPLEVYFIVAYILPAFFGGGQTIIMAIYSYITDISSKEERTSRIGFVELVSLIITPVGSALSGVLFLKLGYYGVFLICFLLFLFGVLYGIFFIKETRQPIKREKNICLDIFNIKTVVVDIFKIIFRKRKTHRQAILILCYFCYILIKGPLTGEKLFVKYYALNEFNWEVDKFGYYSSYEIVTHIIGLFVAVTVFTKKLQINDLLIATIAVVFAIITSLWYGFGNNEIMFWFGPIISTFSGLYIISLRSVVTKLVEVNEIAKAQALFAICEALIPTIYNPIYYIFYEVTRLKKHSAFFLLSLAFFVPAIFILLKMYAVYKEDVKTEDKQINGVENPALEIEVTPL